MNSAGSPRLRACVAQRQPALQRLQRLAPHRHACAACCPCPARAPRRPAGRSSRAPCALACASRPDQFAHAQAAAVEQFHDGRVARLQPGIGLLVAELGQLHRVVHAQRLGQRLGRLGRAHVLHRVARRPAPRGPARCRSRASRRGSARCRGRCGRAPCICATQRRMCAFCTCVQRARRPCAALLAELLQVERIELHRALRPAASRRARARGSARPAPASSVACVSAGAAATARRWPVRRCAPGSRCPCPLWKRCGSGEASTSMPKAGPVPLTAPVAQRDQRHRHRRGRVVQPVRPPRSRS